MTKNAAPLLFASISLFATSVSLAAPLPEGTYSRSLAKAGLKPGSQSFCYEDASGTVWGERIDAPVIPASVTKAYTTFVALKKFGPEFRFVTRVFLSNEAKETVLHIAGDHDGYFVSDQAFYLLNLLDQQGVTRLERLTFDSKFFLNFELDGAKVRAELLKLMTPSRWSTDLKSQYADFFARATALGLSVKETPPRIEVGAVLQSNQNPIQSAASTALELRSLPLLDLLKDMNVHSTNRFAKSVFLRLNDRAEFNRALREELGAKESELEFFDGSGGKANHTTCRITLRLFRALENLLSGYALRLDSVLSVAGMDGGTLRRRFLGPETLGAVMGKTGTLPDVFVSTLAGQISTQTGPLFYGIFNQYHHSSLSAAHDHQEDLVGEILKAHEGKKEIEHKPWQFEVLRAFL